MVQRRTPPLLPVQAGLRRYVLAHGGAIVQELGCIRAPDEGAKTA